MLNPRKLGLAAGIVWGLSMFVCTILAMWTGYSGMFLHMMGSIYPGFTISWLGVFLGAIYGFIDGFVGFFLLGYVYNKLR